VILLADAMILIDLGYVRGLDALPKIGMSEVLDVVLDECRYPSQPTLIADVKTAGIVVIRSTDDWLIKAKEYRTSHISPQDSLNLFYAKAYGRTLLTNEGPLRRLCAEHRIPCHGTLWLIEEAHKLGLRSADDLRAWLTVLQRHDRRLPQKEVQRLMHFLGYRRD
jgi:hypothetical protein